MNNKPWYENNTLEKLQEAESSLDSRFYTYFDRYNIREEAIEAIRKLTGKRYNIGQLSQEIENYPDYYLVGWLVPKEEYKLISKNCPFLRIFSYENEEFVGYLQSDKFLSFQMRRDVKRLYPLTFEEMVTKYHLSRIIKKEHLSEKISDISFDSANRFWINLKPEVDIDEIASQICKVGFKAEVLTQEGNTSLEIAIPTIATFKNAINKIIEGKVEKDF